MTSTTRRRAGASAALGSALLALAAPASACKEGTPPETFPTKALDWYATIAVVKIDKIDPLAQRGRYAPPFRARGTVIRPLKGRIRKGERIEGETEKNVEGHALCPIDLAEGSTYLLFLKGEESPFVVPRYGSPYLENKDPHFVPYVEAIAGAIGPLPQGDSTARCSASPSGPSPSLGWPAVAGALTLARRRRRSSARQD